MQSIDTLYNGNYFRSRLEARWAVFFDNAFIKYQYEPEGFKHNGSYYLPDFFLPDCHLRSLGGCGMYIEIKPESYPDEDIDQSKWFTKRLCLFKGTPDKSLWGYTKAMGDVGFQLTPHWDNCMGIWKCENCGHLKIEFQEGNYNNCANCKKGEDNYEFLQISAEFALYKRFEHQHG